MNYAALRRPFAALLLSAALAQPAVAATPPVVSPTPIMTDNPAAHPSFTVRVVGKGQPVLLIPGLTCPGAVWDETVARYQSRYQCHVISLAGFGGVAPAAGPVRQPAFCPPCATNCWLTSKPKSWSGPPLSGTVWAVLWACG
ncbi:alpha/beta fold hydrolase [Hymenobacter sp. DG25B]|uniref:alpha/beta fold hydrolase n=1 Tax=Hymenobacter sp. DG25B TaxID=1385664 RepID=UPI0018CEAAF1|nr:hypothetical protein [Hymenobacter sp. DG25B]